jgi:hypothetical protein
MGKLLTGIPMIVPELDLIWHESLGQRQQLVLDFRRELIYRNDKRNLNIGAFVT